MQHLVKVRGVVVRTRGLNEERGALLRAKEAEKKSEKRKSVINHVLIETDKGPTVCSLRFKALTMSAGLASSVPFHCRPT